MRKSRLFSGGYPHCTPFFLCYCFWLAVDRRPAGGRNSKQSRASKRFIASPWRAVKGGCDRGGRGG